MDWVASLAGVKGAASEAQVPPLVAGAGAARGVRDGPEASLRRAVEDGLWHGVMDALHTRRADPNHRFFEDSGPVLNALRSYGLLEPNKIALLFDQDTWKATMAAVVRARGFCVVASVAENGARASRPRSRCRR